MIKNFTKGVFLNKISPIKLIKLSYQNANKIKNNNNQQVNANSFRSIDFCQLTSLNMKLTQAGHLDLHLDFGIENFAEDVEYGFINQGNLYIAATKDSLSSIVYR